MEMGVTPIIITSSDPLTKFLLPISTSLCSADLEVLVLKRKMLLPGDTKQNRLPPGHFGLLMPLNQQAKGVSVLGG